MYSYNRLKKSVLKLFFELIIW